MILRPSTLKRRLFFMVVDTLIIAVSVAVAFALRFDFEIPDQNFDAIVPSIVFLVFLRITLFYLARVYDMSWRHFGFHDLSRILSVLMFSTLLFVLFAYMMRDAHIAIPRSVIPIEFFLTLFGLLVLRASKRLYFEKVRHQKVAALHTLVIATADRANTIMRSLGGTSYHPVAIIDEGYSHMKINGVDVYTLAEFEASGIECEAAIVDETILIGTIYGALQRMGIKEIKIASAYLDYGAKLHEISVEDLLARHPKDLDQHTIAQFINNKTVLITGAGGSIGSEIARQCAMMGAKKLILLDHSEYNLYTICEELAGKPIVPIMQSVVDKARLEEVFALYRPQIVLHAAAYKHVPLVEENIATAITNNVIGTKNAIDVSIAYGVEKFVLISTDKAVRPTNVMGATKRVCELYVQNVPSQSTEVVAVRFGNVLGSSGSVIPKFRAQIARGGPITVTHPDITRYFMLIPEACALVLQAGAIGKGGEIFILDMGEPVRIVDLAHKMIELSGKSIDVTFTGLRPGEKLYEELLIDESDAHTLYDSITVAKATHYPIEKLQADIEELHATASLAKLKEIVPEFVHNKA
ncbi:MAG: hypothetical protein KU28_00610 [Sulfurovum sp. PC08-66]|nr:MAG: hypothetical protein KU28_00610 [Sulfurovum sp. PC08-66]KIM12469.1 MAG: hypothetical protein KU37_00725 [Sulfuricurvum sp. PC08-66]